MWHCSFTISIIYLINVWSTIIKIMFPFFFIFPSSFILVRKLKAKVWTKKLNTSVQNLAIRVLYYTLNWDRNCTNKYNSRVIRKVSSIYCAKTRVLFQEQCNSFYLRSAPSLWVKVVNFARKHIPAKNSNPFLMSRKIGFFGGHQFA
jgi:hypothetical protein